ncbi:MAG: 4-(cytidine 5'-diphospho)-2-C-methyl-D-erythritol kinase [Haliea sp.]|nr:4-(cytidine 5'-diphospho)-2-C-methyl-D-erythritol kinase [Haliea sp.]
MKTAPLELLSPAKLNLFLHVTGRGADGYHHLQTLFQLLDWGDHMTFRANHSGKVQLQLEGLAVPPGDNLILRAAALLARPGYGVDIHCRKRIPLGGGLGGGSSNAATTLLALNHLWRLDISQAELRTLGRSLGADVPVFVAGHTAWAEGIGEVLTPVTLPECWYLIIHPGCHVPTAEIFSAPELTRDSLPITIAAFFGDTSRNDCEKVVTRRFPEVEKALNWLSPHAEARLTGTGACVFARFASEAEAQRVAATVPREWQHFVARGVDQSPVHTRLQAPQEADSH